MSIIDSIKSAASDGLHLAESVEKLAENGLGTLVNAGEKALTATAHLPELALQFTSILPGIAETKSLVSVGENVLKSSTSGDVFKLSAASSIASMVPGLGALVGAAALVEAAHSEETKKDDVFKYVSTDEWKQILNDKSKSKSSVQPSGTSTNSSLDNIVPKAHIDQDGVQFERTTFDTTLNPNQAKPEVSKPESARPEAAKVGQTKIEGNTATHTETDGTVTTQTGGHTEIQHDGRKIVKDTASGVVQEYVGDRLAFQQNNNTQSQEWNTKQGLRVVEESGQYKVYNKDGTLIATRPVSVIANEVQQESETLANGDHMRRHLSGRIMDRVRRGLLNATTSGSKEWDVYSDGVSRTLSSGVTVGMMSSDDAFVEVGTTTIVRKAQDKKYYSIQNGNTQEIDVNDQNAAAPVKQAITMLRSIDRDNKLHLGDGSFLTVRDGKVVGGTDEIIDEPVPTPDGTRTAVQPPKQVEVTMVTTSQDESTSTLLGGYQSTYDWKSHKNTIAEPETNSQSTHKTGGVQPKPETPPKPKPIVVIDDRSVTTDDVITTKQGTTDRVTHDFIGRDESIATSNGIKVSAANDIQFADGVKFGHDGTVQLADGQIARVGSNQDVVAQQASSALAAALSVASSVAGKAASGTITFDDIALLQSSIFDVQGLIGSCMAGGNLEVAQSLMKTGAGLESALNAANQSFAANTALRAMKTNLPSNSSKVDAGQFDFLIKKHAA